MPAGSKTGPPLAKAKPISASVITYLRSRKTLRERELLQPERGVRRCKKLCRHQGKLGMEEYAVFYPPNGVIPFHGFSMYVAPLCFLYHEPSKLYQIFREMYVRFFFRLHSISSHPSGIVSLCLLFETLLQTHLPQLFYHLREIGAQPLRISFKWMVRAFSGYLATDQLLLLWDRILGYNSLEILAVLAAAVFAFRAVNLMEVTSLAAAEAVLADLSTLKVMPLLQIFLFATVT
ncbi:TBC1 domain family member 19 [Grus japonensis]|uniref:TBC1 domain family member 19 n=1 Tax=Grus japonensis TaxID=30415 RepID=A0ABC9WSX5_GRUJA